MRTYNVVVTLSSGDKLHNVMIGLDTLEIVVGGLLYSVGAPSCAMKKIEIEEIK